MDGARLTDVSLWESQRAEWSIPNVICEAAYWDKDKQKRTLYQPGEFERLYATYTKIVLHYAEGISLIEIGTIPTLIQQLEAQYPGYTLRLEAIQTAEGGATVTLVIEDTGERTSEERETLKKELEVVSHELILSQRAMLEERTVREKFNLDLEISQEKTRALVKERIIREKSDWERKILYEKIIPRITNKGDVVGKKVIFNTTGPVHGNQIGDVSGEKLTVSYIYNDLVSIKTLVSEMTTHSVDLPLTAQQRELFETQLSILKEQIAAQTPNHSLLQEALHTVRHILEAGVAHILVSPWLHTLQTLG